MIRSVVMKMTDYHYLDHYDEDPEFRNVTSTIEEYIKAAVPLDTKNEVLIALISNVLADLITKDWVDVVWHGKRNGMKFRIELTSWKEPFYDHVNPGD